MLERLEHSVDQEREFALHASHELKTPLTIMRGQLETGLRDESLTEGQRELFASHLDELQRLASIVDQLALLAQADAGIARLKIESVRLDELVREVAADAETLGAGNRIGVEMEVMAPATVSGDRHRLRQLLLILTDNGLKFNRPGGRLRSWRKHPHHLGFWPGNRGPGKAPRQYRKPGMI